MKKIVNGSKKETRTLRAYISGKLGMTVTDYTKATGVNRRTLYDQWESTTGRAGVMNAVQCLYVDRFHSL